jgi:hypothetical protein
VCTVHFSNGYVEVLSHKTEPGIPVLQQQQQQQQQQHSSDDEGIDTTITIFAGMASNSNGSSVEFGGGDSDF